MTDLERKLWQALRLKSLGFRFRRQHPVGDYVLDFFCWEGMLCVEVDGEFHDRNPARDMKRDAWLAGQGIVTQRFSTVDLIENFDGVLETIYDLCCERAGRVPFGPHPDPPPQAGEGEGR
jgi:very-short-patch-repair endonuclease